MYVDVHTHLTHEQFATDWQLVVQRAEAAGLKAIVVNGLDPDSNRLILQMAEQYDVIKPALGIYPVDAVCHLLPADFKLTVARFDVDAEIDFIDAAAAAGKIAAVGECGLDGYWLDARTYAAQERVFGRLIDVAMRHDLPLIIHTRKLEQRAADILKERRVTKVNFHCFGGRTRLAQECAETHGWYFSIPANATVNEAFRKMLKTLPPERILTETDAPYLPPRKGERNEPSAVVGTIEILAALRSWTVAKATEQVWSNYSDLFGAKWT
ncbi:MAG: TatD family deoxyribonuclease [Deltaproteobacteria bacterium]|nr:TatD family deoxyribonuclease [Deltaproteobacteria bacterium]